MPANPFQPFFHISFFQGIYDFFMDLTPVLIFCFLLSNAIKYYSNGGSIDDKRFLKNNFDKDDEFVRVYSTDNFLGLGKLSKHNNTISVKSDKMFI